MSKMSKKILAVSLQSPEFFSETSMTRVIPEKPILFAHEVLSAPEIGILAKSIPLVHKYPERALVIGRPQDVIALNAEPDPGYIQFLRDAGLCHSQVLPLNGTHISKYLMRSHSHDELANYVYSPFYPETEDHMAARNLHSEILAASPDITMKFYDKASFKDVCMSLGIAMPTGPIFDKTRHTRDDLEAMIQESLKHTGKVIIRESGSSAGVGTLIITPENISEMADVVMNTSGTKYLVEAFENVVNSPSVIGIIYDNQLTLLAQTTQLLAPNLSYLGNLIEYDQPMDPVLHDITSRIGNKMKDSGYVGPFGVDYITTKEGKVYPVECNARITGAFYVHEAHQRIRENGNQFPVALAFSSHIDTDRFKNFSDLEHSPIYEDLLYKGDKKPGIIPLNPSLIETGKFQGIIVADSTDQATKLQNQFVARTDKS